MGLPRRRVCYLCATASLAIATSRLAALSQPGNWQLAALSAGYLARTAAPQTTHGDTPSIIELPGESSFFDSMDPSATQTSNPAGTKFSSESSLHDLMSFLASLSTIRIVGDWLPSGAGSLVNLRHHAEQSSLPVSVSQVQISERVVVFPLNESPCILSSIGFLIASLWAPDFLPEFRHFICSGS